MMRTKVESELRKMRVMVADAETKLRSRLERDIRNLNSFMEVSISNLYERLDRIEKKHLDEERNDNGRSNNSKRGLGQ